MSLNFYIKIVLQLPYAITFRSDPEMSASKEGILKNRLVLTAIHYSDSGYRHLSKQSLLVQRNKYLPLNIKTLLIYFFFLFLDLRYGNSVSKF